MIKYSGSRSQYMFQARTITISFRYLVSNKARKAVKSFSSPTKQIKSGFMKHEPFSGFSEIK